MLRPSVTEYASTAEVEVWFMYALQLTAVLCIHLIKHTLGQRAQIIT
jgi:hypothetical protein